MSEMQQKEQALLDFLSRTNTKIIPVVGRPENDPVVYALVRDVQEGRDLVRYLADVGVEHMIIGNYGSELAVVNRSDMGNVRETISKLQQMGALSEPLATKGAAGQGPAAGQSI